ncbi:MAG: hypothetical protein AB7D37_10895 [Desulfovibrio sp.]
MSNPRNTDEAMALAQAMLEIALAIAREMAGKKDGAAPAPEMVPA